MAQTDAKALDDRDRQFAERLRDRDSSVIADIDLTYSPVLHQLLRGHRVQKSDADIIVQECLFGLWQHIHIDPSKGVRALFFCIGRRRLADHFKDVKRRRNLHQRLREESDPSDYEDRSQPIELLELQEQNALEKYVLALIEEACDTILTDKQRLAFDRRFNSETDSRWAKKLETETGISAKNWRKYSDDARQRVSAYLADLGVEFAKKEERHEVA